MGRGSRPSPGREDTSVDVFPVTDGPVPEIDPSKPHSARIYDYGLGGKNHFAADRAVADRPWLPCRRRHRARENREFLGRAVRYLAPRRDQPVPRHRGRAAVDGERPRGGAAGGPEGARRLHRQRPDGPLPRAGAAQEQPRGPHRLHPGGPAGPAAILADPVTRDVSTSASRSRSSSSRCCPS